MLTYLLLIFAAVAILWKCADWFVEGAVGLAEKLNVPPMLVGLVLVSIATTSPELMTSLLAALHGNPELALGNAVGSVIVDASVALGLAAAVSATPLLADPKIFRSSAMVLLLVIALAFIMSLNGVLGRAEGAVLIAVYVIYTLYSYFQVRKDKQAGKAETPLEEFDAHLEGMAAGKILLLFFIGFSGVLLGSELLLKGALGVAGILGLPPVVTGLTITAIGTSTPEIATCVAAALKRQSSIGVGNIIGADILNICWVAGLSATANPLIAEKKVIFFMFPAVLIVVLTMLGMLRYRYSLTRINGVVLLSLYALYVIVLLFFLGPAAAQA